MADTPEPRLPEISRLIASVHRHLDGLFDETTGAGSILSCAPVIVGDWWKDMHAIRGRLLRKGDNPLPIPAAPGWLDSFVRPGSFADAFNGEVPDGVTTLRVQEAGKAVLDWCEEAARSRGDVGTDTPADVGDVTPQEVTPGVYQQLAKWAADKLKGKQRRTVELLAENNGRIEMKDLATDPAIDWEAPFDNQFNSLAKAVNPKLRKIGWRIFRQSNEARAEKWQGQK